MLTPLRAPMLPSFSSIALLAGCDFVDNIAESQNHAATIAAEIEGAARFPLP